jgi:hypothetical protein
MIYVKWKLRHVNPEAYADAMVAQTTYLADVFTIPITGITTKQMTHLSPAITSSPFCTSVEQTRRTESEGRWNILTKKMTFEHAKNHVNLILSKFNDYIPEDIAETPPTWIRTGKSNVSTAASSEGDDSYMTTSARSFASLVTAEDRANKTSTPITIIDMTKVKQDELATTESMTVSEVQIQFLAEQNMKLLEKIESLTAQVASLLNNEHRTQFSTTPDTQMIDQDLHQQTKADNDRITNLEKSFAQAQTHSQNQMEELKELLRQSLYNNKRPETETTDASSLGPASKRLDTKSTPQKSPPLAKANPKHHKISTAFV